MTRTQYYTATSIDGFIADQHNSLEWLLQFEHSVERAQRFERFFSGVGAMAMGATTFEWVLDHDDLLTNPERWRAYYGDTPCWIFTHRDLPAVPGADLEFVSGDVRSVHGVMAAAAGGRNVWLVGGGELVGQFIDHGLLDEIVLGIAPVFLGAGSPLLPRNITTNVLLTGVEHDDDFAFLTYEVANATGRP